MPIPPCQTPLSDLRSRWHSEVVPIGSTIDSPKMPIVELGLAYTVSRVGAIEGIENMNVATLTYSPRKKIQDRVNMSRLVCISLKI